MPQLQQEALLKAEATKSEEQNWQGVAVADWQLIFVQHPQIVMQVAAKKGKLLIFCLAKNQYYNAYSSKNKFSQTVISSDAGSLLITVSGATQLSLRLME